MEEGGRQSPRPPRSQAGRGRPFYVLQGTLATCTVQGMASTLEAPMALCRRHMRVQGGRDQHRLTSGCTPQETPSAGGVRAGIPLLHPMSPLTEGRTGKGSDA